MGLSQRKPRNRAKSPSVEQRVSRVPQPAQADERPVRDCHARQAAREIRPAARRAVAVSTPFRTRAMYLLAATHRQSVQDFQIHAVWSPAAGKQRAGPRQTDRTGTVELLLEP